jgi:hypothetical protein
VAAALYAAPDNEQELAAFGFLPQDYGDEAVEIWPENQPAVNLFSTVSTQWRMGLGGASGLDYGVLFSLMDRMGIAPADQVQLLQDVRAIELEALPLLNKKPDKND